MTEKEYKKALKTVLNYKNQIKDEIDAGKLIVYIHSPGGDETRVERFCASIATVIAMAGSNWQDKAAEEL